MRAALVFLGVSLLALAVPSAALNTDGGTDASAPGVYVGVTYHVDNEGGLHVDVDPDVQADPQPADYVAMVEDFVGWTNAFVDSEL